MNCTQCGEPADLVIFRGVERIYACRAHCSDIMNAWEGQQSIVTVAEAASVPEGTGFERHWLAVYNDSHWFNQELVQMFVRLLTEEREGFWNSNGLVYQGPEEKAAIMSMLMASLSSLMGKTMAVFLTAPGVTLDQPEMAAMVTRLLEGHAANAREEVVSNSALLEREFSGRTVQ